jgi:hypothetical protein
MFTRGEIVVAFVAALVALYGLRLAGIIVVK